MSAAAGVPIGATPETLAAELSTLSLVGGTASSGDANDNAPDDEHLLTPELLASVTKFIPWGSGDKGGRGDHTLMNTLLAVGPSDAKICRSAYLKDHGAGLDYLKNTCRAIVHHDGEKKKKRKYCGNIRIWMKENPQWRKLCVGAKVLEELFALASSVREDGKRVTYTNPFSFFRNPAVAIECGLLDVLKHLVEEVGIDVNSVKWSSLTSYRRTHLLAVAMKEDRRGCFNYLLGLSEINPNGLSLVQGELHGGDDDDEEEDTCTLIEFAIDNDPVRPRYLEALLEHPACDMTEPALEDDPDIGPLTLACLILGSRAGVGVSSGLHFAKMKIFLKAGADPMQHGSLMVALGVLESLKRDGMPNSMENPEDLPIKIKVMEAAICRMAKYVDFSQFRDGEEGNDEDDGAADSSFGSEDEDMEEDESSDDEGHAGEHDEGHAGEHDED